MIAFMLVAGCLGVVAIHAFRLVMPPRPDFVTGVGRWDRARARAFRVQRIGAPEAGTWAQRMVRRLQGLNLIGADLVEVSPPFDPSGMTAWVGVSIMFELLCVLADAVSRRAAEN